MVCMYFKIIYCGLESYVLYLRISIKHLLISYWSFVYHSHSTFIIVSLDTLYEHNI